MTETREPNLHDLSAATAIPPALLARTGETTALKTIVKP
jgi:hypothetical protein